jgi:hypothetical protein
MAVSRRFSELMYHLYIDARSGSDYSAGSGILMTRRIRADYLKREYGTAAEVVSGLSERQFLSDSRLAQEDDLPDLLARTGRNYTAVLKIYDRK